MSWKTKLIFAAIIVFLANAAALHVLSSKKPGTKEILKPLEVTVVPFTPSPPAEETVMPPEAGYPDYTGEKILYDVKYGKLYLGKCEFSYLPKVNLDGKELNLMVFVTRLSRFFDRETIYSDPETLLPVKIKRDVLNLLKREYITEDYNQKDFSVTITKENGRKQPPLVIKSSAPLQNPILLPQYVRKLPELVIGTVIPVNIPNKNLELKLVSVEKVKVPAGTFEAFHFQSDPRQIEIWISADENRIPLKIVGTGPFGYILAMREYTSPNRF